MNSIIIDCSAGMSLFVLKGEEIFSYVDENEKRHTDDLLVELDNLLKQAGLMIADIQNIGVCVGPGSFTGVRVAISVCKGLCVGSKMRLFALENFDIYKADTSDYILVLEGFSNFVYVRKNEKSKIVETCENINELVKTTKEKQIKNVFVQNEKLQKIFKTSEINSKIAQNNTIFAFNEIFERGKDIELNKIQPVYLRASQAEIERNKKLGEKNEN